MGRLDQVINSVKKLYSEPNPVIDWNEWVYEGHIKVVADWVEKFLKNTTLTKRYV